MLKLYAYKNCDACRKAVKWLNAYGVAYNFIDITQTPPTVKELEAVLAAGFELKALFNRSGTRYRELDMKSQLPGMPQAEALKLLSGDGYLVKRPLALAADGQNATVGFREADYSDAWG